MHNNVPRSLPDTVSTELAVTTTRRSCYLGTCSTKYSSGHLLHPAWASLAQSIVYIIVRAPDWGHTILHKVACCDSRYCWLWCFPCSGATPVQCYSSPVPPLLHPMTLLSGLVASTTRGGCWSPPPLHPTLVTSSLVTSAMVIAPMRLVLIEHC